MIYLDYSATTKADPRVVDFFSEANSKYFANPNSLHALGKRAKHAIERTSALIAKTLGLDGYEIIFTSGATEANNLAIKGVLERYADQKKRIIATYFEHASIITPLGVMQKKGFTIDIVRHDKDGRVDLNHLRELMGDDVALVSIGSVSAEIGIRQPVEAIAAIVEQHNCLFHCDATQSIGKEIIDLRGADLITFSAHKFYGLKGVGVLAKKKDVPISTQIHGGSSTTSYRAGTPSTPLILSLGKALSLAYKNHLHRSAKVQALNDYLRSRLERIPGLAINTPSNGLPHILNFSLIGISSRKTVLALSKKEIYISNHSACSSRARKSLVVLALTGDEKRASSSLRVSLSHLSTKAEINKLVAALRQVRRGA